MIEANQNPWAQMKPLSKRRVHNENENNIFWIVSHEGKYGFLIQTRQSFDLTNTQELRGIEILKRNADCGNGEFYLILNDINNWEVFRALCMDLISASIECASEDKMIGSIEIRLRRWQKMLQTNTQFVMSVEQQMGLFSELKCLQQIVTPVTSKCEAILAWVGAERDKQDFLTKEFAVEVKSQKSSKRDTVHISSIDQLGGTKSPLYLVVYSLSLTEDGENCLDLVNQIRKSLNECPSDTQEMFEDKLIRYGYFPNEIQKKYIGFVVDKVRAFFVDTDFPKILSDDIAPQISMVEYSIDLTQCKKHEISVSLIVGDDAEW